MLNKNMLSKIVLDKTSAVKSKMKSLTIPLALFIWGLPHLAQASGGTFTALKKTEIISKVYTRYLAFGRTDSQMIFNLSGSPQETKLEVAGPGSIPLCKIYELNLSDTSLGQKNEIENAGRIIYEATRCLVLPHFDVQLISQVKVNFAPLSIIENRVAVDLLKLTAENVSVIRAIFQIFLKDGIVKARTFANYLLSLQPKSNSKMLSTTIAIQSSLDLLNTANGPVSDSQSLSLAVSLARLCAEEELLNALTPNGFGSVLESEFFKTLRPAMDTALAKINFAYTKGKYLNNSITFRETTEGVSPLDFHFFIDPVGAVQSIPVIGIEGSLEYEALRVLIASSSSEEHILAIRGLGLRNQLSLQNLISLRGHFERLVFEFSKGDETKKKWAQKIIREQVETLDSETGIEALLNRIKAKL